MKKEEAMKLAPERSRLLCNCIQENLSDVDKVNGEIRISSAKIDGEKMVTFDIFMPTKNSEQHLNTGITAQQIDVLTEQVFRDLIDNFLESDTMGCTRYYSIRGGNGLDMDGVNVVSINGGKIKLNFECRGEKFHEQAKEYNSRLNEFQQQQEMGHNIRK